MSIRTIRILAAGICLSCASNVFADDGTTSKEPQKPIKISAEIGVAQIDADYAPGSKTAFVLGVEFNWRRLPNVNLELGSMIAGGQELISRTVNSGNGGNNGNNGNDGGLLGAITGGGGNNNSNNENSDNNGSTITEEGVFPPSILNIGLNYRLPTPLYASVHYGYARAHAEHEERNFFAVEKRVTDNSGSGAYFGLGIGLRMGDDKSKSLNLRFNQYQDDLTSIALTLAAFY